MAAAETVTGSYRITKTLDDRLGGVATQEFSSKNRLVNIAILEFVQKHESKSTNKATHT